MCFNAVLFVVQQQYYEFLTSKVTRFDFQKLL